MKSKVVFPGAVETITHNKWLELLPGERTKWQPVYSYIRRNNEYIKYQMLWFEPYIDISRREAE